MKSLWSLLLIAEEHIANKASVISTPVGVQVRASKLMRHATRLPRDILFWKEQEELLPQGFAYMESLEKDEEDRIQKLLESTSTKRGALCMMYNEDDLWAKQRCSHVFCAYICFAPHGIFVKVGDDHLPNELLFLENRGTTMWKFSAPYFKDDQTLEDRMVQSVKFLQGAQRCEEVVFTYCDCQDELHTLSYTGDALKRLLTKIKRLKPNI